MGKSRCSLTGFIWGIAALAFLSGSSWTHAEETTKIGEVVVTATRGEKDIADAPASVEVVTKGEIEKKKPLTVDQSMYNLPGVFDRRGKDVMDTQANIALRGLPGQNRTLILMDGMPLNNGYTGDVQWQGLAPEDVEKIEVVKGPFSALYGGKFC